MKLVPILIACAILFAFGAYWVLSHPTKSFVLPVKYSVLV